MSLGRGSKPCRLTEACHCHNFWGLTANRNGAGLDSPEDDYVAKLREWRQKCPDYGKQSHSSFCERCDNSYPTQDGGVEWLKGKGVVEINPYQKFPEPLEPRKGPEDSLKKSSLREQNAAKMNTRLRLVTEVSDDTIKGTSGQRLSVQENPEMSDYIRDLLRMSGGGALGGRDRLDIPSEIMDAMAGDAAQEALMKERVLEEMRRKENGRHNGGEFVSLDLMMEMDKADVDKFIDHARKKIIKRSKSTRKGCCLKIGGVLDQLLGPGGDEYADPEAAKDRGQKDPIGESFDERALSVDRRSTPQRDVDHAKRLITDHVAKHGKTDLNTIYSHKSGPSDIGMYLAAHDLVQSGKVHGMSPYHRNSPDTHDKLVYHAQKPQQDDVEVDLVGFIAEEFALREHSDDCPLREALEQELSEQEKWIQKAIKKPGSLRSYFGVKAGEEIPVAEAREKYAELQKKAEGDRTLGESDSKLFKRLQLFLKVLKPANESLDEASHTGAVGDLSPAEYDDAHKTRGDNAQYPTALKPVKQGGGYDAGELMAAKGKGGGRYEKGKDPIGEDELEEGSFGVKGLGRKVAGTRKPTDRAAAARVADAIRNKSYKPLTGKNTPVEAERLARQRFPAKQSQTSDVDYDGPQISETANAVARFMEAAHTGSVGNLNPTLYDGEKKTRGDNSDYPTALKPAGQGGGYDAGAPKSRKSVDTHGKHRYDKGADPIGEDELAEGSFGVKRLERKVAGTRKATDRAAAAASEESVRTKSYKPLAGSKPFVAAEKLARERLAAKQHSDVDYDGPQISETAFALSAFMEAAKHTGAVGDMSPTPYWGEKKTRPDNKDDYVKTGQDAAKGERGKGDWDPANKGESKPRYEKGADPLGGATAKQFKRP